MIVYIDSASFSNATSVFLDELLTIIAPDGYYSDGSYYRKQVNGKLIDLLPCVGIDTVSITAVGETTATFNGNLINNGGDVNAVRGFVYGTSANPTTANSVITDTVRAQGTYSLNATGLTSGVTYYVRAYTIVFGNTIYGNELSFIIPCSNCIPGTEITIGTQIWTGCNLNIDTYRDGTPIYEATGTFDWMEKGAQGIGAWCYYGFNPANAATYGKLYNWHAINNYRGFGPVGYHVPTDEEFNILFTALGGSGIAGGKMKEAGFCHWQSPNEGATNSSGFTGLPGGIITTIGGEIGMGNFGDWWSTSEQNENYASNLSMAYNNDNAFMSYSLKEEGLSVRLIKD